MCTNKTYTRHVNGRIFRFLTVDGNDPFPMQHVSHSISLFQFLSVILKSSCPCLAEEQCLFQDPSVVHPEIFNYLAQQGCNLNFKHFLNSLLVNVALSLKDENGIPHALVSVPVAMWTCFAEFCHQDVPYKMDDFKGWEGAFVDVHHCCHRVHKMR